MNDGYRKITQVNKRLYCPDPSWIHGPVDDSPLYSTDLTCRSCGYQEDGDATIDSYEGHWNPATCPHCGSSNIFYIHLIDGEEV